MLHQHDHTPLDSIAIHFVGQPVPLGFVTPQLKSDVHSRVTCTSYMHMYPYFLPLHVI